MRSSPRLLALGALSCLLSLAGSAALAQTDALDVAVRDSMFDEDGTAELVVNVTGSARPPVLEPSAFTVTENGEDVGDLEIEPLLEQGGVDVVATVLVDVSGSMAGEPMEQTRAAAADLARQLTAEGIAVGVLTFGGDVTELSPPTDDAAVLVELIEEIEAEGETPLYDALVAGVRQLAETDGQHNLIVFSDGGDTVSEASLADAIGAAQGLEVPISIVAFETDDLDPSALNELANETEGRVVTAADVESIAGSFEEVATDLASQYVVRYSSDAVEPDVLDVAVAVAAGGASAEAAFTVPNPRTASEEEAAPSVSVRPAPEPGVLASTTALAIGLVAAFLALVLLLGVLLTGQRTRGDRLLGEQLARYIEGADRRAGRSGLVANHFRDRMLELVEASPMPRGFADRLEHRLEQAAWPLRNGEFLLMSIGAALTAGALTGVIFNWVGGVILGMIAGGVPRVILEVRRSRRRDAFLRYLPDTLQLMAGSLRAGYGVLQAIDTVAKESAGPATEEFQRVITEARLGMPVEEALEAMAERVASEDFRWVVLAINIQREVGGNLAELLDTVAETLREREMLRRQIKVLSAEGRLSAAVLIALPFVLVTYLILVRPEYISTLVTSGFFGWMMVIGAGSLMIVGILWIRRLIQIEV